MPSSALDQAAEPKPDYSRLTRAEISSLVALHRAGKTQTEIAQSLNCSISTVHKWVHELTDTTEISKLKLRASASDLTDRLIAKAKAPDILEILDRLGVAEKRQQESGKGGVTVLVGGHDARVQVQIGGESGPDNHLADVPTVQVIDTQVVS